MRAIWAPIMYLENITFPGFISILSRGSHILECIFIVIKFYQDGTYKGLIWAKKPIWGPSRTQKSLYGAHVGPEWNKCPDSAHIGPTYTCLLGCLQNEWMDVDKPCTAILLRQGQELTRFW